MLNTLLRLAFLIGGMVLLLDTFFPTKVESLKVDLHSTYVYNTQNNRTSNGIGDTEYTLHFIGGRLSSCTVGYAAYSGLHDGDAVDVQETKILKRCITISKAGQVMQSNKYWRLLEMLFGFLLLAAGFGWIKTGEIGDINLFSWLRW